MQSRKRLDLFDALNPLVHFDLQWSTFPVNFLNYYLARRAPYILIRPHLIRISAFPYARDAYSAITYFATPYPPRCILSPRLRSPGSLFPVSALLRNMKANIPKKGRPKG